MSTARGCDEPGCGKKHNAQGYCLTHYMARRRTGELGTVDTSLEARFWRKVNKTETCWLWTGSVTPGGYGQVQVDGKLEAAHRVSMRLAGTPIPDDLFACHTCDVRHCVNPAHIFAGTQADNMRDMIAKGRQVIPEPLSHCTNGHALTPDNTYVHTKNGYTCRSCRVCLRAAAERYAKKKRSAA